MPDDLLNRLKRFLSEAQTSLLLAEACLSAPFPELDMPASRLITARDMLAQTQAELRRLQAWLGHVEKERG